MEDREDETTASPLPTTISSCKTSAAGAEAAELVDGGYEYNLNLGQQEESEVNLYAMNATLAESDRANLVTLYTAVCCVVIIIAVGAVGNLMVILAVKKTKRLQTISNIFIVNLSVCDLMFVTLVLPFNMYTYIADGWFLFDEACQFIGFLGYTLTGTTLMNISLIAWNRYKLVADTSGYARSFTKTKTALMIVMSWLLPVLCLLPALLGIWGKFGFVAMLVTCNLMLNHRSQSFKLFLLVVRAVIPSMWITYCYVIIYRMTTSSHQRVRQRIQNPQAYSARIQKHELRMTRMMGVIFMVFILSYFPCTITGIIDWNTVLSKHFHMYCALTVYIGSAVNPMIYGLMNSQFRDAYLHVLGWGSSSSTMGSCSYKVATSDDLLDRPTATPSPQMVLRVSPLMGNRGKNADDDTEA